MAVGPHRDDPARPPLITRHFVAFLALTVATMVSVYLLFSVLPLYASTSGGTAAGLVTGALMLATVLTEIATPSLMVRLGPRWVLALGAVLLALPTALLLTTQALPAILAVALARGVGLGLTVVTGTAMAAELAPPHRRSESLAVYGLACMIPGALAQPAGLWVVGQVGFSPDFVIAVAAPLATCWLVLLLPRHRGGEAEAGDRPSILLAPGIRRPALIFLSTTIAVGIYSTFLALALGRGAAGWAAVALLAQNGASALCRWASGRAGDRLGNRRLIVPGLLIAALGATLAIAVHLPAIVIGSMLLFGAGFGVLQNATLASMLEGVPRTRYGSVSGMWNATYDGGMGLGAVGFGYVSAITGFPIGFALTAVLVLVAIVPALLPSRARAVE